MPIKAKKMNEKTRQLILYLVKNNPKSSITSLMKLAYLSDLVNVKRSKKQISNFNYKRYHYGPFDRQIYSYVETLTEDGLIFAESDYGATGEEFSVFSIVPEKSDELDFSKLNASEVGVVDKLLNSVRGYGARFLTEIAYKTKPMKGLKATVGGSEHLGKKLNLKK